MSEAMSKMGWTQQNFNESVKKYNIPPKSLIEAILG